MKPVSQVLGTPRVSGAAPVILPESRHEIWHQDPRGDLDACYFDLPTPVKVEHVKEAAKKTWDLWTEWKGAPRGHAIYKDGQIVGEGEDKYPTSEPLIKGPFRVPDYDRLDLARYYMIARWKQRSPILVDIDTAAEYAGLEYPSAEEMYANFFANLQALSNKPLAVMEHEAREQQEMAKVAEQERQFHEELARRLKGD